ncbi:MULTISPECIES: hypothetical protein [unclassified Nocardioides]|uniref:hypothetical protein n=1 Tax=unclassified Nocardioides TaxID=2615069 RepID=UPI0006F67D47|nr:MULTISPECIES: hypothetical protein [unclassified Nocardioides]KQY56665.1 hypothetical protein ASD30_10130 [Nocardioides sp. Root140]KQZ75425.1 hypothetical protein ASD66_03445 [Nocardioides sp. Root151]KRF14500.1 hypothetical protein ASH02_09235 [Nocardioides sp. Soil796]
MGEVNPDQVLAIAKKVAAEPHAYVQRAHHTVANECPLQPLAFGILPSAFVSSSYEGARAFMGTATEQGTEATLNLARGLGDVARAYGSAEAVNTVNASLPELPPTNIDGTGDSTGGQIAVVGAEVGLLVMWSLTGATIVGCSALAPTALGAMTAWAVVQPDDAALSRAFSAWGSARMDSQMAKNELAAKLSGLNDAWPSSETAREAYDSWKLLYDSNLDLLIQSLQGVETTFDNVVDAIGTSEDLMFGIVVGTLALLITLTALELIPGASAVIQPIKQLAGLGLTLGTIATVIGIGGLVFDLIKNLNEQANNADGFQINQPGNQAQPHFEQLPRIDWAADI